MRDRFSSTLLKTLSDAKILGIRAGTEHGYTGVWVVVVGGRVFARSWNDKPTGWFRALRHDPDGTIQVGDREIAVTARVVRSERLRNDVSVAYGAKYDTKASQKWVTGFADSERAANTVELIPRKSRRTATARGASPKP